MKKLLNIQFSPDTKTGEILFNLILILLAVHLFYTNAHILISHELLTTDVEQLSLFQIIKKYFFAATYSLLTVMLIKKFPKLLLLAIDALIIGFGVYLCYNVFQDYFVPLTAVYLAVYTTVIAFSSGLIAWFTAKSKLQTKPEQKKQIEAKSENNVNEQLQELKKEKLSLIRSHSATKDEAKKAEKEKEINKVQANINELLKTQNKCN